jgi:hypothetical protein
MPPNSSDFPYCYLDPQITDSHLDAPVQHIVAVASPATTQEVYNTTVNHWRLFFVLSPSLSVVFDMVKASGTDVRGVLGILLKHYAVTNRSVKQIYLPAGPVTCTVRNAWHLLHSDGFLRYKYTAEGEGCRAWVANAVNAFENEGRFLEKGSIQNVLWPVITRIWMDPDTSTARDMQSGNFY